MAETRAPIVFSFKGFDQLDNAIKKLQTLKTLVNDVNKVEKIRARLTDLEVKSTKIAALKGKLTRAEKAIRRGEQKVHMGR